MSTNRWIRTRKGRPCPICGRPNWCGISSDGRLARCMRTSSDRPSPSRTGEMGWIHELTDDPAATQSLRPTGERPARQAAPTIDFDPMLRGYRLRTDAAAVRRHADCLGVSADSLFRLGIVWCGPHRAWGFPMRDSDGKVVGIRLRAETGRKWAVSGSRQGLFIPDGRPAPDESVLICEGPTDVAALLDLGLFAVGRPSCTGCCEMLAEMLGGMHVVIIADRDEPKARPDGSMFCPGRDGAERLAEQLHLARAGTVKIIYPLNAKDAREWKRAGATGEVVRTVIRQRDLWRPKGGQQQ